jgi:pimeloyl-ACP methyl ester carboxylesterase
VIEYLVDYQRVLAGAERPFDEAAARDLIRREIQRAHDFAARRNHEFLPDGELPRAPLSSIGVPTLVIHGTADPIFPIEHGRALAEEIPGARLLPLQEAGRGIELADWEMIASAIVEHTGGDKRVRRG